MTRREAVEWTAIIAVVWVVAGPVVALAPVALLLALYGAARIGGVR